MVTVVLFLFYMVFLSLLLQESRKPGRGRSYSRMETSNLSPQIKSQLIPNQIWGNENVGDDGLQKLYFSAAAKERVVRAPVHTAREWWGSGPNHSHLAPRPTTSLEASGRTEVTDWQWQGTHQISGRLSPVLPYCGVRKDMNNIFRKKKKKPSLVHQNSEQSLGNTNSCNGQPHR